MARQAKQQAESLYTKFFERFAPTLVASSGATEAQLERCALELGAPLPASLQALLCEQNGGCYQGGLLHVLGAGRPLRQDDLVSWNLPELWKAQYRIPELETLLFFAEDLFGNQFGLRLGEPEPAVWRFDAENGELDEMAPSLPEFLNQVLVKDGDWLLGADYLTAYRESGAPWVPGYHLAFRTPGLLGGAMDPANLVPQEPWVHLYLTGQIVAQLRYLPPGLPIAEIRIDPESLAVTVEPGRR